MLGASLAESTIQKLKSHNKKLKIVKYQCGNSYVVDMERSLFGENSDIKEHAPSWDYWHDETWYIPQQHVQNAEYYKTIYRHKDPNEVKVVPFVWDNEPLDEFDDLLKYQKKPTPEYTPKPQKEKRLSIMEPNLNVVKWSMIPILAAEELYREFGEDAFKQLYVGSGKRLLKNEYYISMVKHLDLVKKSGTPAKIQYVHRTPISTFLSTSTDIVVSHQWENPLNYAYLDALYYGYPIVHNADMIKDAGYYYEGFNISEAKKALLDALQNHDNSIEEYKERSNDVLDRYRSTNPKIVDTYKKLLENLFQPNKHEMSYEYDWKTNLYK